LVVVFVLGCGTSGAPAGSTGNDGGPDAPVAVIDAPVDAPIDATSAADAATDTAPPSPAACPATITMGDTLLPTTGEHFLTVSIASAGSEVGLVYEESIGTTGATAKLQRLTPEGIKIGDPVLLATITFGAVGYAATTVASNSAEYIACWLVNSANFACAPVPLATGPAGAAHSYTTSNVMSLAYGPGGWVLGRGAVSTNISLQFLDDTANALGASMSYGLVASTASGMHVVPTATGYALGTVSQASGAAEWMRITRVDRSLIRVGSDALVTQDSTMTEFFLSASGDDLLVLYRDVTTSPGPVMAVPVSASNSVGSPVAIAGATTHGYLDVAGRGASFLAAWDDTSNQLEVASFDSSGAPTGGSQAALDQSFDQDPIALAAVADGFLVASTVTSGKTTIDILHLACP
jgi:hypothetical protein